MFVHSKQYSLYYTEWRVKDRQHWPPETISLTISLMYKSNGISDPDFKKSWALKKNLKFVFDFQKTYPTSASYENSSSKILGMLANKITLEYAPT